MENIPVKDFTNVSLFNSWLGLMNYAENLKQTTNDELMEQMKKTNTLYLERIIEQNKTIISKLESLENKEVL